MALALPLAYSIGWLAWLFLSYMLLVVKAFAALPLSSIEVGSVDTTLIGIYYLVLAITIGLNSNRKKLANLMPNAKAWLKSGATKSSNLASRLPKRWVIPPLLVVAVLASAAAATMPDDNLHISFLDVGEGDAILVAWTQLPKNNAV